MIKVEKLSKKFDKIQILNSLNLNVKKGSIYGLIGTNGAGKTTLIRHIAGVLCPDNGTVTIDGQPVFDNIKVKERLGYIPDDLYFFSTYNLKEMSRFFKSLYPCWNQKRFEEMAQSFRLDTGRKLSQFSKGGQKQAAFLLTMSAMPDYLLLDETIDGIDPIVRQKIWNFIMDDVADREMTVLVSSHNLRELEGVCDSIGILSNGTVSVERDLDDLKSDVHKIQVAYRDRPASPYEGLTVLHREQRGSVEILIVREKREKAEALIRAGHPAIFDILPLSLEEIFIYEVGGTSHGQILF